MKRALITLPILLALTSGLWLARATYSYYFTQTNPTGGGSWTTADDGYGNSVLVHSSTPGSYKEVKATLGSSGYADIYLGANLVWYDAFYIDTPCYARAQGNYMTLNCGGQLAGGYVYNLPNSTVRVISNGGRIIVYVNDQLLWVVYGGPGGSSPGVTPNVAEISFAYGDTTAPTAISSGNIAKTAYSNHVDLSWPAANDDTNGSGVYRYEIYRGGSLVGATSGLSFSDTTVAANNTYSYSLKVVDFHLNEAATTFNVTTPAIQTSAPFPSATPEGRRVGVRPTGAYWGAGGENIDVMSGNLNFTLPLLAPQARGGWGASVALSYNSQNFRWDPASSTNWKYGRDVGYGFGFRLMVGSITPVFSDPYTVSYYLFTDSSGAEYRLDQNASGTWTSKESIYLAYTPANSRLTFKDGSFWYFGCISAEIEPDAGVMYPTLLQDPNGNQITIKYKPQAGAYSGSNASARIDEIDDIRNTGGSGTYSYKFTYIDAGIYDPLYYPYYFTAPHLTNITSTVGDAGTYKFTYWVNQSLSSPFNSQSYGSANVFLRKVGHFDGTNTIDSHEFTYNTSGEITQIKLPANGKLGYDYVTTTYSTGTKHREVQYRKLYKDVDGTTYTQYTFSHEASPGASTHAWTQLNDPGGIGRKYWEFGSASTSWGLVTKYQGIHVPSGPTVKAQTDYTWTLDAAGKNSYISSVLKTHDPGQSYAAASKTEQTIDNNGNVTQVKTYDFNSLTTPLRTDNFTYSGNRLATGPNGLSITYDQCCVSAWASVDTSAYKLWDQSMKTVSNRGNPTTITSLGMTTTLEYGVAGQATKSTTAGVSQTENFSSTQNYAVPTAISVQGTTNFDQTFTYSSDIQPLTTTTANGAVSSVTYDSIGRPLTSTSPFGATATMTYGTANQHVTTATINGRWTKTTLDGLGRPILSEAGYGTTTVTAAETEYDSCGCSPTGKVKRTALPHAPGASPVWATMTYDGIGRTLSTVTVGTETTSTTTYLYEGNTVKITDAAGKWKKYTSNVLGQLTQVNEPNPAGGSDYVTNYSYDVLGNLTNVSMPRPTGTQTRTFNYNTSTGLLTSATNPESGTVSYTYNSDKTLQSKVDAKGQKIEFTYDAYKRVTQTRRYPNGTTEDTCQREDYAYDTNPYDGSFTSNAKGRLAAVQFKGGYNGTTCDTTFTEMYTYSTPGAATAKRLRVQRGSLNALDLDTTYSFDNEGRNIAIQYPSTWNGSAWIAGPNLGNEFDEMGRLKKLKNLATSADIISATTYNATGALTSMTGANGAPSESRTFNSIGQMTQLTSGSLQRNYSFSSPQNNGKIISENDPVSGETVSYTYDSLNRLASATSSDNPGWAKVSAMMDSEI